MTNWQEYLAGTDPLNANSVLRITGIRLVVEEIEITWTSEPDRTYAVELATAPNGPYLAIHTGIQATPPENRRVLLVNPATVPGAFFRVVVSKP